MLIKLYVFHYGELVPWNPYSRKACTSTVLLSVFHSVMHACVISSGEYVEKSAYDILFNFMTRPLITWSTSCTCMYFEKGRV